MKNRGGGMKNEKFNMKSGREAGKNEKVGLLYCSLVLLFLEK